MHIGVVYYFVSDIGRALNFYRDRLGLRCRELWLDSHNPWAELEAGSVLLGLEEVRNKGTSNRPPWGGAVVSFQVLNIAAAKEKLERNEVRFTTDILVFEKIKVAQFKDPDGNLLEIHERL